jgi:general secretion pathway protein K
MTVHLPRLAWRRVFGGAASRRDGFIIVAALWILIALTTLVSIYAVYVVNTAYAVGVTEDRPQAEAQVAAAVELTAYQLTAVAPTARPSSGAFRLRMGPADVAVEYRSEAARIDLNFASKELLVGLFTSLGTAPSFAEEYANRIVGWRTAHQSETITLDPEAALYRAAGRPYGPRRAAFPHVGELWLVLGLPPPLIERAMPYLTVFSGQPTINILDAAPQVVAALPGMAPDRLFSVLNARTAGTKGQALLEMLGPARDAATIEATPAVRVSVLIRFDNGRQTRADAVILPGDKAPEPYRVLSWHIDYDEALRSGQ